jgi:hypothetical protein
VLGAEQSAPAGFPCLAPEAPALTFGEAAPDPMIDRSVHRVLEALFAHGTPAAYLLGKLVLSSADGEPQVGVDLCASAEGPPVLILQQYLSKLCAQSFG